MAYTFFMAMAAGFAVAAPIGPVSVVCVRSTLFRGLAAGLAGGLGAAVGDALFAGLAGVGVSLAARFLHEHAASLSVLGGLALAGLGLATFQAAPPSFDERGAGEGRRGMFFAAFLLTIANPLTFLAFVAAFAWLGVGARDGGWAAALLVSGVFVGAFAWWSMLAAMVARWRNRLESAGARRINRISGAAIAGFGVAVALRAGWLWCRG